MKCHQVLKEIHLSYFCNVIKSRSEYFECSIIHFPRKQPRTTLGFTWKSTAAWGKCHYSSFCGQILTTLSAFPLIRFLPHLLCILLPWALLNPSLPESFYAGLGSIAVVLSIPSSSRIQLSCAQNSSMPMSVAPKSKDNQEIRAGWPLDLSPPQP